MTTMATSAANTFPVHNADVITNFFRTEVLIGEEAQLFTKSDLVPVPKAEVVQTLYMRVLQLLFPLTPERHSMVPLDANIQNPEYYEGATFIISVHTRMSQFLPMCLVNEFSLSDLLRPKRERSLMILSGIMNFLQFRKGRMEVIMEKQSKARADADRLQAYKREIQEAERKIKILTTIPPEQQAEADELAAALAELQTATMHEYKEVQSKQDSIAEWKSKIAETSQKLAQAKVDVANLKEDVAKLKSQVVESPEDLKNQMEKMQESIKTIKISQEQIDERVVELQTMAKSVSHTELEVQQMFSLLQDLESSMNKCKELQEENQELAIKYENMQKELKSLSMQEEQLQRTVEMKRSKQSTQSIRRQKKREMKEHRVEEILGECDHMRQKREEVADKIQEISCEMQQLKAKIKGFRDVCTRETQKAQALYETVSKSMVELHNRIESHVHLLKKDITKMAANI